MKKLILLIAFLMIAFTGFSQIGTRDSLICLPVSVLREAAKDIVRGDECREELKITQETLYLLEHKSALKDSIIQEQNTQLRLKGDIINLTDQKVVIWEQQYSALNKRYKTLYRNDRIKMGVGVVIIGTLAYLLITK